MYVLIGILGLALLMVVHEGGHFLAARAFGMRVTKFSIGFGPTFFKIVPKDGYFWFTTAADKVRVRLFKHNPDKHGPTIYQVAMIPFLAYVQIAGMNPLEEIEPNDKGSYANASVFGRVVTIFAGPLANYLFASVFFFFAFVFGGMVVPQTEPYIVPTENSPAAAAGLRSGDRVVEVGGVPVTTWKEMADQISQRPSKPTTIVVERGNERVSMDVTPKDDGGVGRIGVMGKTKKVTLTAKESAILAVNQPPVVVKNLIVGLGELFTGKAKSDLHGPIKIVQEMSDTAKSGFTDLLSLLGMLSAYLGAFNLIPFPALDGGRLMFLGYEAATRRRANQHIETAIHFVGFVMLFGLMIYVTVFKDILGSK